ncbi:TPA_asm: G [Plectranthus aromaticus virus 1]|uniref:G n=1 Tax=Plectranthus aromaticus virus 1 TaxID=2793738 RepID=A0A8D9PH31_9RHAB|nr:G [Plectranthus aromaticus virus 1] [Plectranthus aromaticus virus 1]DAF42301.1 TPA_asm: G [Plectranthus aromaticus virus 1]
MDSMQPYYVCDRIDSGSAVPITAWHYSCKQSCMEDNERTAVNITRVRWHYVGEEINVYKIITNEVCYTAHENMWGYCTQSQTIKPVSTTEADKVKLEAILFSSTEPIQGTKIITNSGPGDCEYFSDNTNCGRDYTITYRPGKTSKKSEESDLVLNVYGDGIRTDPKKGALYQNDVAWVWDPKKIGQSTECGWGVYDDDTCRITTTSEMMHCPNIGYQYNIHTLKPTKTCKGDVYDIDGPAPFLYKDQKADPKRDDVMKKAAEGKSDPDISMIKGINAALERIEETYCSSSCDLFARGFSGDDNQVLDTPIGNWRLAGSNTTSPKLVPCTPTSTWRTKSPTLMCHGKNHILVEDSKTKHTCSWDTTRDYITVEDTCVTDQKETDEDIKDMRHMMMKGEDIRISFWTGDTYILGPPYNTPRWERNNLTVSQNPSWFSKVEVDKSMLHNQIDLSRLLTNMTQDTKQEIMYNKTSVRSVKSYFIDEVVMGAGAVGATVFSWVASLLGVLPKFALCVVIIVIVLWIAKEAILQRFRYQPAPREKIVKFNPDALEQFVPDNLVHPTAPKRRPQSRATRIGNLFSEHGL